MEGELASCWWSLQSHDFGSTLPWTWWAYIECCPWKRKLNCSDKLPASVFPSAISGFSSDELFKNFRSLNSPVATWHLNLAFGQYASETESSPLVKLLIHFDRKNFSANDGLSSWYCFNRNGLDITADTTRVNRTTFNWRLTLYYPSTERIMHLSLQEQPISSGRPSLCHRSGLWYAHKIATKQAPPVPTVDLSAVVQWWSSLTSWSIIEGGGLAFPNHKLMWKIVDSANFVALVIVWDSFNRTSVQLFLDNVVLLP